MPPSILNDVSAEDARLEWHGVVLKVIFPGMHGTWAWAPCIQVVCLIRRQTWRGENVTWQLLWPIARLIASLNPWKMRRSLMRSRKRITFAWPN